MKPYTTVNKFISTQFNKFYEVNHKSTLIKPPGLAGQHRSEEGWTKRPRVSMTTETTTTNNIIEYQQNNIL